ncbi:MAG: ABC transporter substrate-binding protein, partial [Acidimicrobiia bacterium]
LKRRMEALKGTPEPVLVYSILDENEALGQFFPESRAALAAAAAFVNDNGGLGGSGRMIEIEICVGEVDADQNAECGRELVASNAIAAVGSAICTNDTAYPILNEATPAVPNIGALTCLPSTFAAPNAFWVNHGLQGSAILEATIACKVLQADTIFLNLVAVDSILATQPVYDGTLQAQGCNPSARTVTMERDQFDGVPAVAQFGEADVVLNLLAPPQPAPVINAAAQQGTEATLVFTPTNMSTVILNATAGNNDGVMTARWYRAPDADVPGNDDFRTYLERTGSADTMADEFGTMAWVSVMALDQAFRDCADCDFTREGAQRAMEGLSGFDAGGLAPTLDYSLLPLAHPAAGNFPRIPTLTGFAGIVEGGEIVSFGDGAPIG